MKIYGLCGVKQSGKDSFAKMALSILNGRGEGPLPRARTAAFADPLKEFCVRYLDVPSENCRGTDEQKNAVMGTWGGRFSDHIIAQFGKSPSDPVTAREIMQVVGTEIFRGNFRPTFWCDIMLRSTLPRLKREGLDAVFITDVRFANEIDAIESIGGGVLKIERPAAGGGIGAQHASETELANIPVSRFKAVIVNDSTIDDLRERALSFLRSEGLAS